MTSYFQEKSIYLYNCKNLKKTFLQLRCSNVLLHLRYKLPLCKPEIEFKNQTGAKALATDHREKVATAHKMKSHQETTSLGQLATVTAKTTISDKHL